MALHSLSWCDSKAAAVASRDSPQSHRGHRDFFFQLSPPRSQRLRVRRSKSLNEALASSSVAVMLWRSIPEPRLFTSRWRRLESNGGTR